MLPYYYLLRNIVTSKSKYNNVFCWWRMQRTSDEQHVGRAILQRWISEAQKREAGGGDDLEKPKTTKKSSAAPVQVSTLESELKNQKLITLRSYVMKKLKKDITEEEDLLTFLNILFPTTTNQFRITPLVIIIFVCCPAKIIETGMHEF